MKVLVRGIIHKGKIYHKDGVILGPGYMEAYQMSEGDSRHSEPCILVSKDLVKNNVGSMWIPYDSAKYFLNYFRFADFAPFDSSVGADSFQQVAQTFFYLWESGWPSNDSVIEKKRWTMERMVDESNLFAELYYKNHLIRILKERVEGIRP